MSGGLYATVLEQESETTVKVLTAAVATRPDYKPDPKSRHRGQLAAYLRAAGSKVPSMYGGGADEPMNG